MSDDHVDRRTYLGSHAFATLMGYGYKNQTAFGLYNYMVGNVDDTIQTEQMGWGLRLQDVILDHFGTGQGMHIADREVFRRHAKYSFIGGTADGLLPEPRREGVDAKNIGFNRGEWGDPGSAQMPKNIICQCHHFNMLFDAERWHVAVLFGGSQYAEYVVERDKEMDQIIIDTLSDFWANHIEKQNPPEIDGSDAARDFLAKKFADQSGEVRAATVEEIQLLREYSEADRIKGEAEIEVARIKNKLRESIGNSKGLVCDFAKVGISKPSKRQTLDKEKFKDASPDAYRVYLECMKESDIAGAMRITFTEN